MDARVNYVILPVAKRLLRADQAALASAEGYLATTMMHEISHAWVPRLHAPPQDSATFMRRSVRPIQAWRKPRPILSGSTV